MDQGHVEPNLVCDSTTTTYQVGVNAIEPSRNLSELQFNFVWRTYT